MPKKYLYGSIALLFLITLFNTYQQRFFNFHIYQEGIRMLLAGHNPYADWQAPYDVFVYGPVFADLFFPFAFFNPSFGNIIYNTLGSVLLVLGITHLPVPEKAQKPILLYSFPLIAQSVFANQFNTFVAASFLWIYIFYVRKKDPYALAIIAFSGLIKVYTLVALLLWLFRSDKWRNALWFLLFTGIAFCLPLLHFSWDTYLQLLSDWRISLSHRHGNSLGHSFFSITGFMADTYRFFENNDTSGKYGVFGNNRPLLSGPPKVVLFFSSSVMGFMQYSTDILCTHRRSQYLCDLYFRLCLLLLCIENEQTPCRQNNTHRYFCGICLDAHRYFLSVFYFRLSP